MLRARPLRFTMTELVVDSACGGKRHTFNRGGPFANRPLGAFNGWMIRQKLKSLGFDVPKLAGPFGSYIPAKRVGNLVFVAGQLPMKDGKLTVNGPVPSKVSIEQAQEAAKICVLNALGSVATLGEDVIDRVSGVLRVGCFVLSDVGFDAQPKVANAASEFLIQLFGEGGRHVRAAVGTNALPLGASVEIEFVFELS